jgi:hypothetical protein
MPTSAIAEATPAVAEATLAVAEATLAVAKATLATVLTVPAAGARHASARRVSG